MFEKMIFVIAAAITMATGINVPASAYMSSLATPAVAETDAEANIIKVGRRFGSFRVTVRTTSASSPTAATTGASTTAIAATTASGIMAASSTTKKLNL